MASAFQVFPLLKVNLINKNFFKVLVTTTIE